MRIRYAIREIFGCATAVLVGSIAATAARANQAAVDESRARFSTLPKVASLAELSPFKGELKCVIHLSEVGLPMPIHDVERAGSLALSSEAATLVISDSSGEAVSAYRLEGAKGLISHYAMNYYGRRVNAGIELKVDPSRDAILVDSTPLDMDDGARPLHQGQLMRVDCLIECKLNKTS